MDSIDKAVESLVGSKGKRGRRNIKERKLPTLALDLSNADDTDLSDDTILDLTLNGPMIEFTQETPETPMPWDADYKIKGEELIVAGHAGPNAWGSAVVKVPKSDVVPGKGDFKLILEPKDHVALKQLRDLLQALNIEYRTN